jgi:curli biogenesis system outer membrane secretion channel CsgG
MSRLKTSRLKTPSLKAFTSVTVALCSLLSFSTPVVAQSLKTAVVPLKAQGEINPALSDALSDRIRAQLLQNSTFKVMERSQMDAILKEQGFQSSIYACQEEDCALDLGRLFSVKHLVMGTVSKVGNLYALSLRMVDTESGEIISEKYFDCYCSDEELLTRGTFQVVSALLNNSSATTPAVKVQGNSHPKDPLITALLNIPGPFGYLYLEEWGWFGGLLAIDAIAITALLANNWTFPGGEATAYLALAGTRIFGLFHGPGLASEKNNRSAALGFSTGLAREPHLAPAVPLVQMKWDF